MRNAYSAVVVAGTLLFGVVGCASRGRDTAEPPRAERPVIKTEAELSEERRERIAAGAVVPTATPRIAEVEETPPARRSRLRAIEPGPGAIRGNILMVNEEVLTVSEVLYPLWPEIDALRESQTEAGYQERVTQLVQIETQRQIGAALVYDEALRALEEGRTAILEKAVERELDARIARQFGGSEARLIAHLRDCGLTLDDYRDMLKREMVVRQYTREKFMPAIQVRRGELLRFYRDNLDQYRTAATRELLIMEFPFAAYLPEGRAWATASRNEQAAARLAAVRDARAAHAELSARPFEDVAREFSKGPHASKGGKWGPIGKPLRPPLKEASEKIFTYRKGQFSAPIETAEGWCIVQCGAIQHATEPSFAELQDEIRTELMERQYSKLSAEYMFRLANGATMSSLDLFLEAAVRRALGEVPTTIAQRTDGDMQ